MDPYAGRMTAPRRRHTPTYVVGALYAVFLAAIGTWPRHVDSGLPLAEWALTRGIANVLGATPAQLVATAEVLANAVLFVPLGWMVAWWWPRAQVVAAVIAGLAVALTIEVAQQFAPIDRTPSLVDVVANVSGACVGFLAVRAVAARPQYRLAVLGSVGALVAAVVAVLLWGLATA